MADDRNWLIDHTGVGVSDIHRSARFYEAALRPLGVNIVMRITRGFEPVEDESEDLGGVAYGIDYPISSGWMFSIPMASSNIPHFALKAGDEVDAFHEAALLAGGIDNGPPGPRSRWLSTRLLCRIRARSRRQQHRGSGVPSKNRLNSGYRQLVPSPAWLTPPHPLKRSRF